MEADQIPDFVEVSVVQVVLQVMGSEQLELVSRGRTMLQTHVAPDSVVLFFEVLLQNCLARKVLLLGFAVFYRAAQRVYVFALRLAGLVDVVNARFLVYSFLTSSPG